MTAAGATGREHAAGGGGAASARAPRVLRRTYSATCKRCSRLIGCWCRYQAEKAEDIKALATNVQAVPEVIFVFVGSFNRISQGMSGWGFHSSSSLQCSFDTSHSIVKTRDKCHQNVALHLSGRVTMLKSIKARYSRDILSHYEKGSHCPVLFPILSSPLKIKFTP